MDEGGNQDIETILEFSGSDFVQYIRLYPSTDSSCSGTRRVEVVKVGTVAIQEGAPSDSDLIWINFIVASYKMKALNSSGQGAVTFCTGEASPVTGVDYNVSNSLCGFVAGTTEYHLIGMDFSVQPARFFGGLTDNDPSTPDDRSTPGNRPQSLDTKAYIQQ